MNDEELAWLEGLERQNETAPFPDPERIRLYALVRRLDAALALHQVPQMSDRELATVLAALREWQGVIAGEEPAEAYIDAIASDGGRLDPLSAAEIDDLCQRLNARKERR